MMSNCGVCGGSRVTGTTTFTVDYKTGVVVARNVPALVCTQCGEESIADEVAAKCFDSQIRLRFYPKTSAKCSLSTKS